MLLLDLTCSEFHLRTFSLEGLPVDVNNLRNINKLSLKLTLFFSWDVLHYRTFQDTLLFLSLLLLDNHNITTHILFVSQLQFLILFLNNILDFYTTQLFFFLFIFFCPSISIFLFIGDKFIFFEFNKTHPWFNYPFFDRDSLWNNSLEFLQIRKI